MNIFFSLARWSKIIYVLWWSVVDALEWFENLDPIYRKYNQRLCPVPDGWPCPTRGDVPERWE